MELDFKVDEHTMSDQKEDVGGVESDSKVEARLRKKNQEFFWSLVEDDIARIIIEIKHGDPMNGSLLLTSLYFVGAPLLALVSAFAQSFDWLQLNCGFQKIVESEKILLNPVYRPANSKNPTEADDPLKSYKAGSSLITKCDNCLLEFIKSYLSCIHSSVLRVFGNFPRNKLHSMYRRIFKRIRFLYCNYYQVTYDLVRNRGPVIRYVLDLDPEVQEKLIIRRPSNVEAGEIVVQALSNLPYLYGEALWIPSKVVWSIFPPFGEVEIAYPEVLRKGRIATWNSSANSTLWTFVRQSGSMVWLNEGCFVHANVGFNKAKEEQEQIVLDVDGEHPSKVGASEDFLFSAIQRIKSLDELLLVSRSYDIIRSNSFNTDEFAVWPPSLSISGEKPEYLRICFSRIHKDSELIVVKSHEVSKGVIRDDLHWGLMRFEIFSTVMDGNCFYDSLLQAIPVESWNRLNVSPPSGSTEFRFWLLDLLDVWFSSSNSKFQKVVDYVLKYVGQTDDVQDFNSFIIYHRNPRIWGNFDVAMMVSLMLRSDIVCITASDGSFRHTSKVIWKNIISITRARNTELDFSLNEKVLLFKSFRSQVAIPNNPPIFILHCYSVAPKCVGKDLDTATVAGNANHYLGLKLVSDMKTIDSVELMNHLHLLEDTLWDNSNIVDREKWNVLPSQECDPYNCVLYNTPGMQFN